VLPATAYQQFELAERAMRLQIARAMAQFRKVVAHLMDQAPGTVNGAAELHLPEYHAPSELFRGMYA